MTGFKMKLIGTGLALGMLVIPVGAGAESAETYASHRIFTPEVAARAQYEPVADYMMLERSPLEQIAGRDDLDWETIQFLEDNLWDHDIRAYGAGQANDTATDVFAVDPDRFSEEIFWQDEVEPVARFAGDEDNTGGVYIDPGYFSSEILGQDRDDGVAEFAETAPENLFPEADDVPQLRAGVLDY